MQSKARNSHLPHGACRCWADGSADYRRRRPRKRFHPGAADSRVVCRAFAVPLESASRICLVPVFSAGLAESISCAICCAAAHHPPLSSPPPPISTCHCTQRQKAHKRGRNKLTHESMSAAVYSGRLTAALISLRVASLISRLMNS